MNLVTENQLDSWVRSNARDAQGLIVELVWRLVAASCPRAKERRFPLGDSIGQHGPDGFLDTSIGREPFVPEGQSFWEIGTSTTPRDKATRDYRNRTKEVPESIRAKSTIVIVTPLSGARDWQYSWKEDAQADWLHRRRSRNEWEYVRLVDGTKLIDWLHQFPAVELWLAQKIHGQGVTGIEAVESWWERLRLADDLVLAPEVFLGNRDEACKKLDEVFDDEITQLALATNHPSQVTDFVCAYLASLENERRVTVAGRCIVITDLEAWRSTCRSWQSLILVAAPTIDITSDADGAAIQEARNAGHAVIYGVSRGGIRESATSTALPMPGRRQLEKALEHSGYPEHQAHTLAEKCGGDLGSLLRLIRGYPVVTVWADGPDVTVLATAGLLGSWSDDSEADRAVVGELTGEEYGDWIARVRDISLSQESPIYHHEGIWKFISRFEAWLVLGRRVSEDDLDKLCDAATTVLRESDPKFELPTNERWLANVSEKVLSHSHHLRMGLADSLALLGSHPKALASCRKGRAEYAASRVVRSILCGADWVLWGSLDRLLPTLAEASPDEFLEAVENAMQQRPCPFDELFSQEDPGIFGRNHLTGLLWALETLAWEEACFFKVCVILGKLAERDPGGSWGNRPAGSLARILLPWLPQSLAPPAKRQSVLKVLQCKTPKAAWNLLLSLMPSEGQMSHPTHRPAWRETIPDDWNEGVIQEQHWEQVDFYANLAVEMAERDVQRSILLVDHLASLPRPAVERFLAHLASESVSVLPEEQRVGLWSRLTMFARKHRQFADSHWAMDDESVARIESIAHKLAPEDPSRLRRMLFDHSQSHLFDDTDDYMDWEEKDRRLEERRKIAIEELLSHGSMDDLLQFVDEVEQTRAVGLVLGEFSESSIELRILPGLLETDDRKLSEFVEGYVWRRHYRMGWDWVDGIDRANWSASETGKFLSLLPFTQEAWRRSAVWLGDLEREYWINTSENPHLSDDDLTTAIGKLLEYGRPQTAVKCVYKMVSSKLALDNDLIVRTLLAAASAIDWSDPMDAYRIAEIIKVLQEDPELNLDDIAKVEWQYLTVLGDRNGTSTKTLQFELATNGDFFCEILELCYRPEGVAESAHEPSKEQQAAASHAHRLLSEWRIPPGTQRDGTFSPDAFEEWLSQVKAKCEESGHLGVAQSQIGQALIHSPCDSNGFWIHRAIANALDSEDAQRMRDGYRIGVINSRGAHSIDPTGKEDRELAEKHRRKAEEVEDAGYRHLATTFRELADDYDREACRVIDRYGELSEE